MLPGITQLSLIVSSAACSSSEATCPLPIRKLWDQSGAFVVSDGPDKVSKAVDGSRWDAWTAELLGLAGKGKFWTDRLSLRESDDASYEALLDYQGMMLSEDYTATFPGGAKYTLDTGYVSIPLP